jgi:AcrR family transcriptional regulator
MGRPKLVDDAVILKAAHLLFMEKGIGATTAEVARRAGVAEATLFKRFGSKPALFRRAMRSEMASWVLELLESQAGAYEDLEEALVKVGLQIIEMARKVVPFMMMSWSSRGEFGPLGADERSKPFGPVAALVSFFETQIKAGRIGRKTDPLILTAGYFGALQHYALVEILRKRHPVPQEQFVRGFVHLLWNGIAPRGRRR